MFKLINKMMTGTNRREEHSLILINVNFLDFDQSWGLLEKG